MLRGRSENAVVYRVRSYGIWRGGGTSIRDGIVSDFDGCRFGLGFGLLVGTGAVRYGLAETETRMVRGFSSGLLYLC